MMKYIIPIILILFISSCSISVISQYNDYQDDFKSYNNKIDNAVFDMERLRLINASTEKIYNQATEIESIIDSFISESNQFREFLINNKAELQSEGIDVDNRIMVLNDFTLSLEKEKFKWSVAKLMLVEKNP